jgi:hypothetical protein
LKKRILTLALALVMCLSLVPLTAFAAEPLPTTLTAPSSIAVDKDATTPEQVEAWFQKVYDKLKSLSYDGNVYESINFFKDATAADFLMPETPSKMWAYPYQSASGDCKLQIAVSYDYDNGIYQIGAYVFKGLEALGK